MLLIRKQPFMTQPRIFNRAFSKLASFVAILSLAVVHAGYAATNMGLIPCDGDDCTINSVMQLINNVMNFFFQSLLLPIFIVMVLYLGYSYLAAQGKPGQHAKLGSMAKHMVLGLVLMLCAWLIVKTILSILGYTDTLGFFTTPS
jgi:hypothetical protein